MYLLDKLIELFSPKESSAMLLLKTQDEMLVGNFQGVPKKNFTWQEVFNMNLRISFAEFPKVCPVCGKKLCKYESDYEKIENAGQHMVQGIYCKSGDFTYLECA
jgi:hypothetical protein